MVMPYKPSSIPTGTTIIPAVDSGVVSSTIFIGSNTLVDVAKYWASHIHKNRLVGIAGQLAVIQDNTANTLTIKGAWSMAAGTGTPYAILGADFMQVLRDVFGGGFDINAGNPLQVFDPKVWGSASGLILSGTVTVVPGADQFTIPTLAGLGAGKFSGATKPFRAFVFRDAGGASAAPQGQMQAITAYDSATGTFTAPGFIPVIDVGDEILILNPRLAEIADILAVVAGGQSDFITEQSEASTVEQNAIQQFNIALFSLSTGAIPLLSIDITGISQLMSRSRAGGAFSAVGITQPVFAKGAGTVYCPYQFLLAEWEMGDLYKLVVSGIKATIGINTFFVPDMVWSNAVIESADLETTVNAIETEVETTSLATGAGSVATLSRLGLLVRWIADAVNNATSGLVGIFNRIGAPAGASVSADILAIKTEEDLVKTQTDKIGDATNGLAAIKAEVEGLAGAAMRGTDNAMLAASYTAERGTDNALLAASFPDSASYTAAKAAFINASIAAIPTTPMLAASGARILCSMDFWSVPVEEVAVPAVEATLNTLPSVVVADLPGGAVIVRAVAMFKARMIENINIAANSLDGATDPGVRQVIQVKDSAAGAQTDAIKFVDEQFGMAASTREGGDVLIGSVNIAGAGIVDANDTYAFRWLLAKAHLLGINFNDVQCGLKIWYSV